MVETNDTSVEPEALLDDPTGRLGRYLAATQTPLDILALLTLWLVVVPPGDFGELDNAALTVRLALSAVYGVDILIRALLAERHVHYLRTHLLGLLVVAFPPLRIIFSLRLLRSVFRRGNIGRFLLAASLLMLNGAVVVYLFERHAPGSNIHTLGESLWWSIVTVTTVGYGDYSPVTVPGRITAVFIMATGVLTLAVVTANVASSFMDQAARRRQTEEESNNPVSLEDLGQRLARIEALLSALQVADGGPSRDSTPAE